MITKLFLSAGGSKGYVYLGIIKYLEEQNLLINIDTISGTSIGSLFALLLSLKFSYKELYDNLIDFEYDSHQSIDLDNFINKYGFDDFSNIILFINKLILQKYSSFKLNMTFKEHFELTNIHLLINALCINTRKNVFFSHRTHPSMNILDAIKASMAIPLIFNTIEYNNMLYVDGGITGEYIPDKDLISENTSDNEYLCINLNQKYCKTIININTFHDYIINLIQSISEKIIDLHNSISYPDNYIIIDIFEELNTCYINPIDLNIKNNIKNSLTNIGYIKIKNKLLLNNL